MIKLRKYLAVLACSLAVACAPSAEQSPVKVSPAAPDDDVILASRIISLSPSLTELVYQAGAGDKLIAVVDYSDYPEAALSLPRIGDSFRIDFERLRQLDPDLVLVWSSGNPAAMQSRLRDLKFNLLVLEPSSIEDVAIHLRLIGERAGTGVIANAAADAYLATLEGIWESYGAEPDTRVFFQISAAPWFTVNGDQVISRIINRCGGKNIFADIPAIAAAVSLEAIIAADPEVIIAPFDDRDQTDWQSMWQRFDGVAAVREGNLINVNRDAVSRSSLRLADAAEQICSQLHAIRMRRADF